MDPGAPLDLGLPWWMAAAMVGMWVALVVGIVAVARQRRRLRRAPRPEIRPAEPGEDLELY